MHRPSTQSNIRGGARGRGGGRGAFDASARGRAFAPTGWTVFTDSADRRRARDVTSVADPRAVVSSPTAAVAGEVPSTGVFSIDSLRRRRPSSVLVAPPPTFMMSKKINCHTGVGTPTRIASTAALTGASQTPLAASHGASSLGDSLILTTGGGPSTPNLTPSRRPVNPAASSAPPPVPLEVAFVALLSRITAASSGQAAAAMERKRWHALLALRSGYERITRQNGFTQHRKGLVEAFNRWLIECRSYAGDDDAPLLPLLPRGVSVGGPIPLPIALPMAAADAAAAAPSTSTVATATPPLTVPAGGGVSSSSSVMVRETSAALLEGLSPSASFSISGISSSAAVVVAGGGGPVSACSATGATTPTTATHTAAHTAHPTPASPSLIAAAVLSGDNGNEDPLLPTPQMCEHARASLVKELVDEAERSVPDVAARRRMAEEVVRVLECETEDVVRSLGQVQTADILAQGPDSELTIRTIAPTPTDGASEEAESAGGASVVELRYQGVSHTLLATHYQALLARARFFLAKCRGSSPTLSTSDAAVAPAAGNGGSGGEGPTPEDAFLTSPTTQPIGEAEWRVLRLLERYRALAGTQPNDGHGHHSAVHPRVLALLERRLGVDMEAFASPLNARLPHFCSMFPDTDAPFGSMGNFFRFRPAQGSFEVNPPFVEEVMDRARVHAETLVAASTLPLSFVFILPHWKDATSIVEFDRAMGPNTVVTVNGQLAPAAEAAVVAPDADGSAAASPEMASPSSASHNSSLPLLPGMFDGAAQAACAIDVATAATKKRHDIAKAPFYTTRRRVILPRDKHVYVDGFQFSTRMPVFKPVHDTVVYVVQNAAGAAKWPFTDEIEAELLAVCAATAEGVPDNQIFATVNKPL